jgi:hypothetical protein
MREIKFRGKRIYDVKWIYGYLMQMHQGNRLFIGSWNSIGGEATVKDELFSSYKEVDPSTVGQFTGLCDKNGRGIYQHDKPGGMWEDLYIDWCEKCNSWELFTINKSECMQCLGDIQWIEFVDDVRKGKAEIIGNIHDKEVTS